MPQSPVSFLTLSQQSINISEYGLTFYQLAAPGVTCVDACKKERAFCADSILASIELYHAFDEGGLTCKSISNITEKTTGAPFYRFLFYCVNRILLGCF